MEKIKKLITGVKTFFKSNIRLAVLVIFILEFFLSIWITPNKYDSEFFIKQMQEMSIFDFLGGRYQNWTSRLIIEFVICVVLPRRAIVWVILNTIMMTILGYSILKIFVKDDDKSLTWMSVCFIFLYPLNKIATCDWGAGSINYTWPLAMLLFSAISIKKIFADKKIAKYMYPIYSLALIFACNQEQCCAIAFVMYFVFFVLYIIKNNKKINFYLLFQLIITILSLIVIATCPGNYARKTEEIQTYYMDFESLKLFDKISLGLTSTVNNLLINTNIVFLVFTLVCAVYIFNQHKNNLYRAVALIPLVSCLIFGAFKDIVCRIYPYFGIFCETLNNPHAMLTPINYLDFMNSLPLILSFIVLGSCALNILIIFKNLKNNIAIVIYLLGVMSRVALGFSPTVFSSTDRTFIFFEFSLILICILIWREFLKETDKLQVKPRTRLATFITILAVLQYSHILIYTLMSQM